MIKYIRERVSWDQDRTEMSPGEVVIKAMVFNLLVKQEPLYSVNKFHKTMDIPNLIGKAWQADDFNDDLLGYCLEKLAKRDLSGIYHTIARGTGSLNNFLFLFNITLLLAFSICNMLSFSWG